MTFVVLEGELMQAHTSFMVKITVTDASVNWCIQFEKANDSAPNPDHYAKLAVGVAKA